MEKRKPNMQALKELEPPESITQRLRISFLLKFTVFKAVNP